MSVGHSKKNSGHACLTFDPPVLVSLALPILPVKHTDTREVTTLPFSHVSLECRVDRIHQCSDDRDFVSWAWQILLLLQIYILLISKKTNKCCDDAGCGGNAVVIASVLLKNGLNRAFCCLESWMIKTEQRVERESNDIIRYMQDAIERVL